MTTMQLEFAQAMSDFATMFPDMDKDVIEAILRANQGSVDATIDQLLAMSVDNQNEKLRQELDKDSQSNTPKKEMNLLDTDFSEDLYPIKEETASISPKVNTGVSPKIKKIASKPNQASPSHGTETSKSKWKPPLLCPLPANFLRLSIDPRSEFDLGDEQFATMLQNEEFMTELFRNEEFLSALEKDQGKVPDEKTFEERLRQMGKTSRKKFTQLAKVFKRKKQPVTARHVRHPDSLLLQEENSDDDEPKRNKK